MKNRCLVLLLAAVLAGSLCAGCKRLTPHDILTCGKLGYFSTNFTHYAYGYYVYYIEAYLSAPKTITSISANIKDDNEAVVMIYAASDGKLLACSEKVNVSSGWNRIAVPSTLLDAGTYRIAVMTSYDSNSGIRMEQYKGTRYAVGWSSFPTPPATISGGAAGGYELLIHANYCD